MCFDKVKMHEWFSFMYDKSEYRHKAIIAIVYYIDLNDRHYRF